MVSVNESKLHLLEGLSPPPPPGPRIEIGDWRLEIGDGDRRSDWIRQNMTGDWRLEIGDGEEMIFIFIFYFWPEEPAAPVLTLRCGGTMCSELFIIKKRKRL